MNAVISWLRTSWLPLLVGLVLGRLVLPRFV